jgi:hypothetical protein
MSDIEKEIKEMEKMLDANTTAPSTNAPGTQAPGTSAPGTSAPKTAAPGTTAPKTAAPATEAPTTAAPPDEMDELRRKNEELEERLKKLEGPKTEAPKTTAPTTQPPIVDEDFVGDADPYDLQNDKTKLNALLNKVYKKGVESGRTEGRAVQERVLKAVPEITKVNFTTLMALHKTSEDFYANNKDLIPHKKVVGQVFEEMLAKNPDKKWAEVLGDVGKEVRQKLKLKSQVIKDDKNNPPKLPRKGAQPRPKPKPSTDSLASEIAAMDDALDQ